MYVIICNFNMYYRRNKDIFNRKKKKKLFHLVPTAVFRIFYRLFSSIIYKTKMHDCDERKCKPAKPMNMIQRL